MSIPRSALVTDFYQLTMVQGYLQAGMEKRLACFDLFFREHPFDGGYCIFAGLEEALRFLEGLRFNEEELDYLKSLDTFDGQTLEYLRQLRFSGEVQAMPEGTAVFPFEPLLRVVAPLPEAQLVESTLLNVINFQTLIATKAARISEQAGAAEVIEFGLRRAQGQDGARSVVRAAAIGGVVSTSNLDGGMEYGVDVTGTHAHSWILAFPSELEAFRAYARSYPKGTILLVDTFDTLGSGVPNAITVAREMRERGESLLGIRLDSGDLAYLSIEARKMLDEAGFEEVKIVASSDLDEFIIRDLNAQGARIDAYGVGTKLATAAGDPALTGVYKLAAVQSQDGQWQNKLKISEGLSKATLPGLKQVYRLRNGNGGMMADFIELEDHAPQFSKGVRGTHPLNDLQQKFYTDIQSAEPLLQPALRRGAIVAELPPLAQIRERTRDQLAQLHPTVKRLLNPHIYKVSIGPALLDESRRLREAVPPHA